MAADGKTGAQIDRDELIALIGTELGFGWHPTDKIAALVRKRMGVEITDASLARILVDLTKKEQIKQRSGWGTTRRWMVPYVEKSE